MKSASNRLGVTTGLRSINTLISKTTLTRLELNQYKFIVIRLLHPPAVSKLLADSRLEFINVVAAAADPATVAVYCCCF